MVNVLTNLYTDTVTQTAIRNAGFSPVPPAIIGVVNANILSNNANRNLDIENASVCQSTGGPGAPYPGR